MSNLKCGIISPSAILIDLYHTFVLIDFRHYGGPVDVALELFHQLSPHEILKVFHREGINVGRKITIIVWNFVCVI